MPPKKRISHREYQNLSENAFKNLCLRDLDFSFNELECVNLLKGIMEKKKPRDYSKLAYQLLDRLIEVHNSSTQASRSHTLSPTKPSKNPDHYPLFRQTLGSFDLHGCTVGAAYFWLTRQIRKMRENETKVQLLSLIHGKGNGTDPSKFVNGNPPLLDIIFRVKDEQGPTVVSDHQFEITHGKQNTGVSILTIEPPSPKKAQTAAAIPSVTAKMPFAPGFDIDGTASLDENESFATGKTIVSESDDASLEDGTLHEGFDIEPVDDNPGKLGADEAVEIQSQSTPFLLPAHSLFKDDAASHLQKKGTNTVMASATASSQEDDVSGYDI